MRQATNHTRTNAHQRMALVQASWSVTERRRRRELAQFLQRRLAWQLALDASRAELSRHG